jgi:hypothetical protein
MDENLKCLFSFYFCFGFSKYRTIFGGAGESPAVERIRADGVHGLGVRDDCSVGARCVSDAFININGVYMMRIELH